MKILMQIFEWLCNNQEWAIALGTGIYEFIARKFNTQVDYSIINFIKKILDTFCPNYINKAENIRHK